MDVRQNQGVWWVFRSGKSDGTDFLAQNTLLHVCLFVAAALEKSTTLVAWSGLLECSGEERMDVRQNQGVTKVCSSGIVNVQIS